MSRPSRAWGVDSEHGRAARRPALPARQLPLAADQRDLPRHPGGRAPLRPRAARPPARRDGRRLRGGGRPRPLPGARPGAALQVFARDSSVDDPRGGGGHPAPPVVAARRVRARDPLLPGERDPDPRHDHRGRPRGRRRDDPRARLRRDRRRRGRTQERAARQLAGWLEEDGWEVRVEPIPERFVHIDVLLAVLARAAGRGLRRGALRRIRAPGFATAASS